MPASASRPPAGRVDTEPTEVQRRTPPQALVDALNPLVRWLATSHFHGLLDDSLVVLHVSGRRTGRRYDIPVGYLRLGDRLLVTTQHRWRTNLRGRHHVDVTVGGVRRTVGLRLDESPVSIAATYAKAIDVYGWREASRRLGLRTRSGEAPSRGQLAAAADAYGLAVLELTAAPGEPALVAAT
jgi:hypothetical protein